MPRRQIAIESPPETALALDKGSVYTPGHVHRGIVDRRGAAAAPLAAAQRR